LPAAFAAVNFVEAHPSPGRLDGGEAQVNLHVCSRPPSLGQDLIKLFFRSVHGAFDVNADKHECDIVVNRNLSATLQSIAQHCLSVANKFHVHCGTFG
jgi:hypothetical protein